MIEAYEDKNGNSVLASDNPHADLREILSFATGIARGQITGALRAPQQKLIGLLRQRSEDLRIETENLEDFLEDLDNQPVTWGDFS